MGHSRAGNQAHSSIGARAHTHPLSLPFLSTRLGSDSPGVSIHTFIQETISSRDLFRRKENPMSRTEPAGWSSAGLLRPCRSAPTEPVAPASAAFRTPGRSEGTQRQSAPAPAVEEGALRLTPQHRGQEQSFPASQVPTHRALHKRDRRLRNCDIRSTDSDRCEVEGRL